MISAGADIPGMSCRTRRNWAITFSTRPAAPRRLSWLTSVRTLARAGVVPGCAGWPGGPEERVQDGALRHAPATVRRASRHAIRAVRARGEATHWPCRRARSLSFKPGRRVRLLYRLRLGLRRPRTRLLGRSLRRQPRTERVRLPGLPAPTAGEVRKFFWTTATRRPRPRRDGTGWAASRPDQRTPARQIPSNFS